MTNYVNLWGAFANLIAWMNANLYNFFFFFIYFILFYMFRFCSFERQYSLNDEIYIFFFILFVFTTTSNWMKYILMSALDCFLFTHCFNINILLISFSFLSHAFTFLLILLVIWTFFSAFTHKDGNKFD